MNSKKLIEINKHNYELLKNKYTQEMKRFEGLDNKSSSLLNISILIFTIELSFISTPLLELFIKDKLFSNLMITIFIIIFITNIIINILATTNLYKSYKITYYSNATTTDILINSLTKHEQFEKMINKYIRDISYAINVNYKIMDNKVYYIKKGSKYMIYSVLLLAIDIIFLLVYILL